MQLEYVVFSKLIFSFTAFILASPVSVFAQSSSVKYPSQIVDATPPTVTRSSASDCNDLSASCISEADDAQKNASRLITIRDEMVCDGATLSIDHVSVWTDEEKVSSGVTFELNNENLALPEKLHSELASENYSKGSVVSFCYKGEIVLNTFLDSKDRASPKYMAGSYSVDLEEGAINAVTGLYLLKKYGG